MNTRILLCWLWLTLPAFSIAQSVGIGTASPHASAQLDVSSTTRGLLAPRMTTEQRTAIAAPAKGLLVYDTDLNGLYHYNGSSWATVGGGGGSFALPYDATVNLNTSAFKITNSGSGAAIQAVTTNEFGFALQASNTTNYGYSVYAYSRSPNAIGVYALVDSSTGVRSASTNGIGVHATSTDSIAIRAAIAKGANPNPVVLATHAGAGIGVDATSNTGTAIRGTSNASTGALGGVVGINNNATAGNGVAGIAHAANSVGVSGTSNNGTGVSGYSNVNRGVAGGSISGTALYGNSISGYGLEVVGKVKISGGNTNPSNGAVLTSDASGNAVWKPNRVAFHAGGVNTNYTSVPNQSARRVQFATTDFYDLTNSYNVLIGTNYQPSVSSTYTVPVDGIYHFDIRVELASPWGLNSYPKPLYGEIVLKRNRAGVVSEIAEHSADSFGEVCCQANITLTISKDIYLQSGDVLYVEVYQYNEESAAYTIWQFPHTYFNGHLVIPQ